MQRLGLQLWLCRRGSWNKEQALMLHARREVDGGFTKGLGGHIWQQYCCGRVECAVHAAAATIAAAAASTLSVCQPPCTDLKESLTELCGTIPYNPMLLTPSGGKQLHCYRTLLTAAHPAIPLLW